MEKLSACNIQDKMEQEVKSGRGPTTSSELRRFCIKIKTEKPAASERRLGLDRCVVVIGIKKKERTECK